MVLTLTNLLVHRYFYNAAGETRWERPSVPALSDGGGPQADAAAVQKELAPETAAAATAASDAMMEQRPTLPPGVQPPLFFSEVSAGPGKQCVVEVRTPLECCCWYCTDLNDVFYFEWPRISSPNKLTGARA